MNRYGQWFAYLTLLQLSLIGCSEPDRAPVGVTETIRALGPELEQSMQAAELVFVGRVENSRGAMEEVEGENSRIVTIHDVTVLESLKGETSSGLLKVINLGGELGDIVETVSNQAHFEAGQDAIFFLERRGTGHVGWRPIGERGVVALQQDSATPVALKRSALTVEHMWAADQRRIGFRINPRGVFMDGDNATNSQDRAVGDIQAGAMHWFWNTRANVQFNPEGTTSDGPGSNSNNLVYFSSDYSKFTVHTIATTTTTFIKSTNRITRFVMAFNLDTLFHGSFLGRCNPSASPKFDAYIEDIATHEFGHALGMNDERVDTTATMFGSSGECSTSLRSLASLDISKLEGAYGRR